MNCRTPIALVATLALSLTLTGCPGMGGLAGKLPLPNQQVPVNPFPGTQPAASQPVPTSVTPSQTATGAEKLKANEAQKASANDAAAAMAELDEFEQAGDAEEATMTTQGFATLQASDAEASPSPSPSATATPSDAMASPSPSPTASAPASDAAATPSDATASPSPAASTQPSRGRKQERIVNADGSVTMTRTRTRVQRNGATGTETFSRTFSKAPRKPLTFEHTREFTGPKGYTRKMSRLKTWTETGWTVTVHIEETLPDGRTRSLDATRTYNKVDATWEQTGTLKRFNGNTLTFSRKKTAGKATVEVTDSTNNVRLTGSLDAEGQTASLTVSAGGTEAGTVTTPEVDAGTAQE